jgi:hypothetical protein
MWLAALPSRRTSRSASPSPSLLVTHRDQTEQHLVALGFEFVYRLAACFFEHAALDDLVPKLGGELGVAKAVPAISSATSTLSRTASPLGSTRMSWPDERVMHFQR